MHHGTGDTTRRCRAHHVSTTPRHYREQRLQSPGKEFSPRARGKGAAGTGERHYVTAGV
jgi:hypothetical protein